MQQFRSVRLGEQPAFEIDSWRQVVKSMRRTGEAVDAAMFTASIRIDGTIETDVGGAVTCDDGLGTLDGNSGAPGYDSVQDFNIVEPIAVGDALLQIEARRCGVAGCPTPTDRL